MAYIGCIHQRDDHFESPQAFLSERFLGKRPEINYYAPFGGGLHSCIGNHFAAASGTRANVDTLHSTQGYMSATLKRSPFTGPASP